MRISWRNLFWKQLTSLISEIDAFSLTPQKNQYAYILEGFDKGWNYVGSQHSTTYTNLPAGTYTFRVKASNNDNVWNEEGTSIRIIVHPPFYFSLPFKIGYFMLFILAIGLLLRYVVRKGEKKHAKAIDELNSKKEKEIHEAKINFFTMIAHEIRTPVSLIIGPLEKVMQSTHIPSSERQELEIIDRNSQRLLYLVNQLLDFRKVEQKEMRMRFTSQSIRELMESVCERFSPTLHQTRSQFLRNVSGQELLCRRRQRGNYKSIEQPADQCQQIYKQHD